MLLVHNASRQLVARAHAVGDRCQDGPRLVERSYVLQ
jgi:hypothetical protein